MTTDIDLKELSGEKFLKLIVQGKINKPNMAKTISMDLTMAEEGMAKFLAYPRKEHLNPLGGIHGGFAATVLDSVTGCAVHSLLGPGEMYVTTDLNIKMIKALPVDITLEAHGRVISISKQISVAEGYLRDSKGIIYAFATATCMIKRKK